MMVANNRETLLGYLKAIGDLPNESAKTHRFVGLIAELFPGSNAVTDFAAGVEKVIRIENEGSILKRGRIDAFYGNAVIEFENSLRATEEEAKRQLREYTAGIWQDNIEDLRPLLCIASDGIVWKVFRPRLIGSGTVIPENVELEFLRELILTEETIDDFWLWLTTLLFRPGRIEPSAERFRIDFGATSLAFAETIDGLRKAWKAVEHVRETQTQFETWRRYLIKTYGSLSATGGSLPELESLFLKHAYLTSIARFLIWASISRGKTDKALRQVADDVHSGRYFQAEGIENIVEEDFFQWIRQKESKKLLAHIWERMLNQMLTYDLSRLNQDIMKGVYQELVDPKDRHDLGEYYTPEWLCEKMVSEMLPKEGFVSVIDPACGSGSFIRATIAHLLNINSKVGNMVRLKGVLENVVGIDINPLAVTISKATYLLALGSLVKASKRPIQIPIYLADSLFLPTEVKQIAFGDIPSYEIRFADKRVLIAEDLVRAPELFDETIVACSKVAMDHAETKSENSSTLLAYLKKSVPNVSEKTDLESFLPGLWDFTEALASLIREKNNSIWAFIIRNGYRPTMLRQKFDYIIGNPPWLSYRYISDPEYQDEVKRRAVEEYKIAPNSKKLFTQMELATLFLIHSIETFGKRDAQIAFVMPRSILTSDQHDKIRKRSYSAELLIESYWDLQAVHPLFNVPACVVFGKKRRATPSHSYTIPATEFEGKLPRRDISWEEAQVLLTEKETTARLLNLGSRSAFSTNVMSVAHTISSPYRNSFRQGATLVPRNFYFVRVHDISGKVDPDRLYWAETDPEQAKSAKPPYKDVRMEGHIEGCFMFLTAIARNVLPFTLVDLPLVILPISIKQGRPTIQSASKLQKDGYREMSKWMKNAETIWEEKRKSKASRQDVYQRLNYQKELEAQELMVRHLVLYNTSGTNLSATHVDRRSLKMPLILDHKLYWASCDSKKEADYLAAVLNSEVVNKAIKPFQSMGLLGERDIHKKVLDLPIPSFDLQLADHKRLAELGNRASSEAANAIKDSKIPKTLGRRRSFIREVLSNTLREIDNIVKRIILDLGDVSSDSSLQ